MIRDYMPRVMRDRDRAEFPAIDRLRELLSPSTSVEPVPVPTDCADRFLLAFWSRPEAVLDPLARAATSGFARLTSAEERAVVDRLSLDLATGEWDRRYGHLRDVHELDVGLRLITGSVR